MNIFDRMHRDHFDALFSLDDEARQAKAKLLREAGVPEEMIADLCSPGIKVGMSFGGAKAIDLPTLVERILFGQRAGSVLLRVTRPPYDEAGHIEIDDVYAEHLGEVLTRLAERLGGRDPQGDSDGSSL